MIKSLAQGLIISKKKGHEFELRPIIPKVRRMLCGVRLALAGNLAPPLTRFKVLD